MLDLRVRKALAHAIDKQSLNEILWGNEGIMADTIFSPCLDFYPAIDAFSAKYGFDLRTSERLMNEASFSRAADGFTRARARADSVRS